MQRYPPVVVYARQPPWIFPIRAGSFKIKSRIRSSVFWRNRIYSIQTNYSQSLRNWPAHGLEIKRWPGITQIYSGSIGQKYSEGREAQNLDQGWVIPSKCTFYFYVTNTEALFKYQSKQEVVGLNPNWYITSARVKHSISVHSQVAFTFKIFDGDRV